MPSVRPPLTKYRITMANLRRYGSGPYHLELRFCGKKLQRSLGTKIKKEANRLQAVAEQTAAYLDLGVLTLPAKYTTEDLWKFLLSGGKATPDKKPVLVKEVPLEEAMKEYLASYATGSKEEATLKTERTHLSHFMRVLGKKNPVVIVDPEAIDSYIKQRQREPGHRGRKVSATTIGKELATFNLFWNYCAVRGWASIENPATSVARPRASQKLPFMTVEQIKQRIERGGLSDPEEAELWDALFLREDEVGEVLSGLKVAAESTSHSGFVYPAIAFCAYTGARRSEMMRTLIDDVNGRVLLREKKRSQEHSITFREVPLHPELKEILDDWLSVHPGGQYLFSRKAAVPLTGKHAQNGIETALRCSKWKVLRGYHVFRHSFASNLARHGTDQRIIDSWMGHQTEAMRKRYQHLFPEDTEAALSVLSFG